MNDVSNNDLMGVLLTIKEDIGSLKTASSLQLEGLKNHADRLGTVEMDVARQKGAARVWGLMAAAAGGIAGALMPGLTGWFKGH